MVGRVEAVTAAWLAAQERAYLGRELAGDADDRRVRLLGELLGQLEGQEYGQLFAGTPAGQGEVPPAIVQAAKITTKRAEQSTGPSWVHQ